MDYQKLYEDLKRHLDNGAGQGIYPMGYLTQEQRETIKAEGSDAYKLGWNASIMDRHDIEIKMVERVEAGMSDDERMLIASGCCFVEEDGALTINMNDTWGWALAWGVSVPKDKLGEVARLFRLYGLAGLTYWHSCQEGNMRSEFKDVNRAIDFVRHEEEFIKNSKSSSERAYKNLIYTLGEVEEVKTKTFMEKLLSYFRKS